MKRAILLILAAMISAGCSPATYRTGAVVINKFSVSDFKTNNFVDIKQDVAEKLRDQLHRAILGNIPEQTKMTIAPDCSQADYELSGRFEDIDSEIDSHWRFVTISVERKFEVGIVGQLRDCRTGKILVDLDTDKDSQDMQSIIDDLASNIVDHIAKVKTP